MISGFSIVVYRIHHPAHLNTTHTISLSPYKCLYSGIGNSLQLPDLLAFLFLSFFQIDNHFPSHFICKEAKLWYCHIFHNVSLNYASVYIYIFYSSCCELIVDIYSYAGNWLKILLSQGQHQSHYMVLVNPCTNQTWYVIVRSILTALFTYLLIWIHGLHQVYISVGSATYYTVSLYIFFEQGFPCTLACLSFYHCFVLWYKSPDTILFCMTKGTWRTLRDHITSSIVISWSWLPQRVGRLCSGCVS
jgi:hypothetical protein